MIDDDVRYPIHIASMVKIKCRHCKGTGKTNLPHVASSVLEAVPRNDFVTTKRIHAACPEMANCHQNAVVNQLNVLLKHDLVEVREVGQAKIWKRKG
jgi:hypothetical protein